MRQNPVSQTVHIQEPTLKEIKKHHGWLKGSFATGCGCIVIFFGALYVLFRLIVGSGPAVVANFPSDFPNDIPQTNPDRIVKIVVIEAQNKERVLWFASKIPHYIADPILSELDPSAKIIEESDSLGRVNFRRELTTDNTRFAGLPSGTHNQKSVSVIWSGIKTEPSVAADNYAKQLERAGYAIVSQPKQDQNKAFFSFSKGKISGIYQAEDLHSTQPGIEFVQLIVNYP